MPSDNRFEKVPISLVADDKGDMTIGSINLSECNSGKHFDLRGKHGTIHLDPATLATHVLFLGTTGSGKTNTLFQLLKQVRASLGKNDVMVIFDTKGDYVQEFYDPKSDLVISLNEMDYLGDNIAYAKWNMFREVDADGGRHWDANANEITRMLFEEAISTEKDPFFPKAASDVTRAVVLALLRDGYAEGPMPDNQKLREVLANWGGKEIADLLAKYKDLVGASKYIEIEDSGQSRGVMAEMRSIARDMLVGSFADASGKFSIREFVRSKRGRTLFIEYDPGYGKLLTPIYRLLFDLAIKESLGRSGNEGNVYYVIDEFARLPDLYHVEDGISLGRGLGAKFIIGTQNVSQVIEEYGMGEGASILANLNLLFCFRLFDEASRSVATERYGKFFTRVSLNPARPGEDRFEQIVQSNAIEDEDISQLPVGRAIIMAPGQPPRRFQFAEYNAKPIRRGKVCEKCQFPIHSKARFCPNCGAKQT